MPADPVVAALAATIPPWFAFPLVGSRTITGFALPKGSVWNPKGIHLTVFSVGRGARVKETDADRLPHWCPELHLNADRSFCLGLDAWPITNLLRAQQWWADVEIHLRLLSVATRTRVWPQHSGLDHDEAGRHQRDARRLARRLGLDEALASVEAGEAGWIGDPDFALVDRFGRRVGLRATCRCGCRRKDGKAFAWRDCPRRRDLTRLILLERARRLSLLEFWESARRLEKRCCGRMRDCPLAAAPPPDLDKTLLAQTRAALGKIR